MATVKIQCPLCVGTGIIGTIQEKICTQCIGTGTVSADDTQTLATVSTTVAAASAGNNPLVLTKAVAAPQASVKILSRSKQFNN